jgi:hypothetical protein
LLFDGFNACLRGITCIASRGLRRPLQTPVHQPHDSHSTRWARRKGARQTDPPSNSPTLTDASHRPCLHKKANPHTSKSAPLPSARSLHTTNAPAPYPLRTYHNGRLGTPSGPSYRSLPLTFSLQHACNQLTASLQNKHGLTSHIHMCRVGRVSSRLTVRTTHGCTFMRHRPLARTAATVSQDLCGTLRRAGCVAQVGDSRNLRPGI